jgi:hypothetical protein
MQEFKSVGYFLLFVGLVLVAVNLGKLVAGAAGDRLPSGLVTLLGGAPQERPPLSEVNGV